MPKLPPVNPLTEPLALALGLTAELVLVLVFVLVATTGSDNQWTWALTLEGTTSAVARQVTDDLAGIEETSLWWGFAIAVLVIAAALSWLVWSSIAAEEIEKSDPHRFRLVAGRVRRWASAGSVLVVFGAVAGILETAATFWLAPDGSAGSRWVDIVRACAWIKWINVSLGIGALGLAVASAAWRLRCDGIRSDRSPDAVSESDPWKGGLHDPPPGFAPRDKRVGVCLSGGGIRSASFSLGALQAIQGSDLPTVRYLTSVSGGSYMAGAWESMRQSVPRGDPVFEPGSSEERWFRHHTDYLVSSFSVVWGALAKLVGGFLFNVLILSAVASVVLMPLGWALGAAHPELRAREPVLDVEKQPEVSISAVRFDPTAPLAGDDVGPGYRVVLWSTPAEVSVATDVEDDAATEEVGVWLGIAVVADGEDGLEVIRQPSVRFSGRVPGESHTGDPDVQSVVFTETPLIGLSDVTSSEITPPGPRQADAVERALTVTRQPEVAQRSGTAGREPVNVDTWVWTALALAIGFLAVTWLLAAVLRQADLFKDNRYWKRWLDGNDAVRVLEGSIVAMFVFLVVAPWVVQEVPKLVEHLPAGSGGGLGAAGRFGVLVATATAVGRYFQSAGSLLGRVRRTRFGPRIVDGLIGLVVVVVAVVAAATILNVAAANGPSGRLEGWQASLLPWAWPSWWRWAIWVVFLLLVSFAPAAHAWSLFPFYRSRLGHAYLVKRDDHKAVKSRLPEDAPWKWTDTSCGAAEKGDPDAPLDDLEWVACTAVNIRGTGEAAPGRAAGSFTFSRSWVGGPEVGWMETEDYLKQINRYSNVDVHVDSTIAISGAAVSPAMGKMSKDWQGRLLAIFNVRLGVWVPNPMVVDCRAARNAPGLLKFGVPAWPWYLRELVGWYDRTARFVYLTDGGHWENLGLVELLRRGCTEIWMISAAGDGADSFETLAQAIALAREQLGVEFEIELEPLRSQPGPLPDPAKTARRGRRAGSRSLTPRTAEPDEKGTRRLLRDGTAVPTVAEPFVTGTFKYKNANGTTGASGTITVIEAALIGDAPWDVHSYAERNKDFPEISTGYQLMDHRDFEAYRMLGYTQTHSALAEAGLIPER